MDQRRISVSDIIVGDPLPWDVSDSSGNLLLRKGHIVQRIEQVEALIERGMFIDAKPTIKKADNPPVAKPKEIPSALRLINLANKRLEKLLFNFTNETELESKFIEVSKAIIYACNINSDVALACILLNQAAGSYPVRHCVDTAIVSLLIAQAMRKTPDEVTMLTAAALTMNVSMIRQQEQMQSKQATLTDSEREIIQQHPQTSMELLKSAGVSNENWLSYVLLHHENEDGSGYPNGKKGDEIPECVKILSLADRYCARVSNRGYRKTLLPNAALQDILLADKKNINPIITTTFIKELGTYPTGTFVKLENGEIAVVSGKGEKTTTPFVHSFIGPRGAPMSFPIKRDTSRTLCAIREVLDEEHATLRFSMQQLWGDEAAL